MFRPVHEAVARLLGRPRPTGPAVDPPDLTREARTPDPYVWRLPNPRDARWRRWARRNRAAGHRLPFPLDEERRQAAVRPQRPLWEASDDVVRLYVLRDCSRTPHPDAEAASAEVSAQRTPPTETKIPASVDFL